MPARTAICMSTGGVSGIYVLAGAWLACVRRGISPAWLGGTSAGSAPFAVSKVALRLALRSAGMESMLDAYLDANPLVGSVYRDAQILMSDNPMFTGAMADLTTAAGLTTEQATAILAACRGDGP